MEPNAVDQNIHGSLLRVYPNPAQDRFCVEYAGQVFAVKIFDTKGRLVFGNTNAPDKIEIDTEGFSKGLYILSVNSIKGTVLTRKLFVQ